MIRDDRDDIEYWNALADRVASAAVRHVRSSTLEWLAQSRGSQTTVLLLAAAAFVFTMLPVGRPADDEGPGRLIVFLPTDDSGKTMAQRDQPPSIGALLMEPPGQK